MAIEIMLIIATALFVLGFFPLYLALKIMGGDASLGKVFLVKLIGGVVYFALHFFLGAIGGAITTLIMLFVYRWIFDMGTIKVIIAWFIETVFTVGAILLLGFLGVVAINSLYQ
ncbi:hypothetical protein KY359_01215 [Candidatus Woesearchaeota archaeon]|nr:hypothetical protein [Candidatus Woesearchaeota archaeon]